MIGNRDKGYLHAGLCTTNGLKGPHKLTLLQRVNIHSAILETKPIKDKYLDFPENELSIHTSEPETTRSSSV